MCVKGVYKCSHIAHADIEGQGSVSTICVFIDSPVVGRKSHTDDVAMDINDMVQRVKKLLCTSLLPEDRTASGHLVRLDPFNA